MKILDNFPNSLLVIFHSSAFKLQLATIRFLFETLTFNLDTI